LLQLKIVPDITGANASWAKAKKSHAREINKEREAENMKKVRMCIYALSVFSLYDIIPITQPHMIISHITSHHSSLLSITQLITALHCCPSETGQHEVRDAGAAHGGEGHPAAQGAAEQADGDDAVRA
jgi:hypothetical protein